MTREHFLSLLHAAVQAHCESLPSEPCKPHFVGVDPASGPSRTGIVVVGHADHGRSLLVEAMRRLHGERAHVVVIDPPEPPRPTLAELAAAVDLHAQQEAALRPLLERSQRVLEKPRRRRKWRVRR
jgi:hypothetical protein